MAETNNTPINVEVFPENTEFQITVTGDLYKRLQEMIFNAFPVKDITHLAELLDKIKKDNTADDPMAYHLHTVLWICSEMERVAKEKNILKMRKYDPVSQTYID